jgi:hypothetical protein
VNGGIEDLESTPWLFILAICSVVDVREPSLLVENEIRGNILRRSLVESFMENADSENRIPQWLILVGTGFFILALAVSAYWEADIRWLHFFQAWMYVATLILAFRRNRWGYFIGASAAGLWDYTNIFATTFLFNGIEELSRWGHTGHLSRPDLLIAIPAWLSNFLVIAGCLWAYSRLPAKRISDLGRFLIAFVLTTGFFALDMALFQPRYLGIFPRLLHPHLP